MTEKYIRSLIESVHLVFSTMVHTKVEFGEPFVRGDIEHQEVVAVIELSGDVTGVVVMSSGVSTAEAIVERFSGEACSSGHPDFQDAVGELINLIAGTAKSKLESGRVSISVPSVTMGKQTQPVAAGDQQCICVPCTTELGTFYVDMAVRGTAAKVRAAS